MYYEIDFQMCEKCSDRDFDRFEMKQVKRVETDNLNERELIIRNEWELTDVK